ncbi:unnamed protein product [Phytophthora fragariaefolia]|uniref:Unnamed protein product n=1 Tax=Phytophthora fragariaefolia TaxID=1490495 RepID=A0A9W6TPZ6_9STRA|nr:unnamed protein product [Phytophthora fragariaefolia]
MPGTLRNTTYSDEMNIVLGMTTRCMAAAIKTQYDVAVDPHIADTYSFIDNGDAVIVRRGVHEYILQKEGWGCDCEFAQTMKLPCRHAMEFKNRRGSPFVIPFAAIASRFVQD